MLNQGRQEGNSQFQTKEQIESLAQNLSDEDCRILSDEKLKASITTMDSESIKKNEEIVKLMKEIEALNSRSRSASMLLHPCKGDAASSSRRGKKSSITRGSTGKRKNESDSSQITKKVLRMKFLNSDNDT